MSTVLQSFFANNFSTSCSTVIVVTDNALTIPSGRSKTELSQLDLSVPKQRRRSGRHIRRLSPPRRRRSRKRGSPPILKTKGQRNSKESQKPKGSKLQPSSSSRWANSNKCRSSVLSPPRRTRDDAFDDQNQSPPPIVKGDVDTIPTCVSLTKMKSKPICTLADASPAHHGGAPTTQTTTQTTLRTRRKPHLATLDRRSTQEQSILQQNLLGALFEGQ